MAELKFINTASASVRASNRTERSNHSRAARRHLRNGYAVEQQLRTLLDSIYYGTVGGDSCAELSQAFSHLVQAVDLLSNVERRETTRCGGLKLAAA